jgi:hypothetical protein
MIFIFFIVHVFINFDRVTAKQTMNPGRLLWVGVQSWQFKVRIKMSFPLQFNCSYPFSRISKIKKIPIKPLREIGMEPKKELADIKQIKADLEKYYVFGHSEYDPALYEQILHPEWQMYHLEGGILIQVDRDEFCRWYEPQKKDPELTWSYKIHTVDVTGDVAQAKLSLENQKVLYLDYLNLMRIAGKWWIVHKIYHQVDKNSL